MTFWSRLDFGPTLWESRNGACDLKSSRWQRFPELQVQQLLVLLFRDNHEVSENSLFFFSASWSWSPIWRSKEWSSHWMILSHWSLSFPFHCLLRGANFGVKIFKASTSGVELPYPGLSNGFMVAHQQWKLFVPLEFISRNGHLGIPSWVNATASEFQNW